MDLKVVFGVVNEGDSIAGISMVSFYTNYSRLCTEVNQLGGILHVVIATNNPESLFVQFVQLNFDNVTLIEPSNWESTGLPPMRNGSFATYFKFDLMNYVDPEDFFVYIDSDAFIVDSLQLQILVARLRLVAEIGTEDAFLMVPSIRPVFERTGYISSDNPHKYFNAGVFFAHRLTKYTLEQILQIFSIRFFNNGEILSWHDQDILNAKYEKTIYELPLRYNISSGMLLRNYFGVNKINYLARREFQNPTIVHASGGILTSKVHYPYRGLVSGLVSKLSNDSQILLSGEARNSIKKFEMSIRLSILRRVLNEIASLFGLSRRYLLYPFDLMPRLKEGLRTGLLRIYKRRGKLK